MSSPQLQIGLRVSWKLYRNLCSQRWLKSSLNLVINLIPLGLIIYKVIIENRVWGWSYKLQHTFLKSRKGLRISYFQVLRYSIQWQLMEKNLYKNYVCHWRGELLSLVLVLHALLMLGSILKRYLIILVTFKRWDGAFGGSLKNPISRGQVHQKPIY